MRVSIENWTPFLKRDHFLYGFMQTLRFHETTAGYPAACCGEESGLVLSWGGEAPLPVKPPSLLGGKLL